MNESMYEREIAGVLVKPLTQIGDERGKIMHMMRVDDGAFEKFGEIYFSVIYPGVVKGWHLHKEMTLNYACVSGKIKLVLFDQREGSSSKGVLQEIFLGEENYKLVQIPPGVWNGFKGVGIKESIVANLATTAHDPAEITRMDPFDNNIGYDWSLKNK